ncbi:MAG TPA: hypothetical protein DDW81_11925 [Cryomorphaceae bacterium]|nr:hypothetical protein [Owenweeksia sp.]HBF20798.1 hypothetical protein [Cryomorphaceae bacterium]|tara:strand:+ start:9672 stop:11984 length:2313 start_codon:yes stop_codon:yes gene_type:complete
MAPNGLKGLRQSFKALQKTDNQNHNAIIFNLSKKDHVDRLQNLASEKPWLVKHDSLEGQIKELYKIRHPEDRLREKDLDAAYTNWLKDNDPFTYGVWVYYPWNNALVHLVNEDEFIELRTSRNKYKITDDEQQILSQKIVGVIGLSVGQSAAVTMAIERIFGTVRIADFDTLELTNLNRIRRGVDALGQPKTTMVAREIAEIDPFLKVEVYDEGINEDNIDRFLTEGGQLDALIEECDGLDIKVLARLKARDYGIPVIMDTSDRGLLDIERFDLEPERPIFHGLVPESKLKNLKGLTTEEKIPYILDMVNAEGFSKRFKASMLEVDQSLTTWPQLSTSVTMGGAMAADLCRRVLLDQLHVSGRFYIDIEELISDEPADKVKNHEKLRPVPLDFSELEKDFEKYALKPDNYVKLSEKAVKDLVEHATFAPSGGNVQPWKWYYREGVLYLFHDRSKSYSFLDYADRGSMIALGAASENIVQRAIQLQLHTNIQTFTGNYKPLVAAFTFEDRQGRPPGSYENLAFMIKKRLTNRKMGDSSQRIDPQHMQEITELVEANEGYHLHTVQDENAIRSLSEVIARMERLRMLDEWGHEDFINEARWTPAQAKETRDGIDLATLDLSQSDIAGMRLLRDSDAIGYLREWDKGMGFLTMTRKAPVNSSALCLLTADEHSKNAVFNGGRILERAWLYINSKQIAMQPVSPSTFMFYRLVMDDPALKGKTRAEMKELNKEFKQILNLPEQSNDLFLFRLFYAEDPEVKSYRYPLEDVLLIN